MSKSIDSSQTASTLQNKADSVSPASHSNGTSDPFTSVRRDPTNEEYWDAVDEAARAVDRPDAVEGLYLEILAMDLPTDVLSIVGQRAIAFLEEWYEDTTRSVNILQGLIARDYENSWALEKLSLLLTLAERWDDLLGTYDSALLHLTDPKQKIHLLDEAARIAKDFAGQAQRASDYLKQLLLLRPDDTKLALSLQRRLEQQERHEDLVDIWTARLAVVDQGEELELRVKIALTLLEARQDAPRSLSATKELLDSGIGEEQACNILERISTWESAPPETQREALDILRQRYARLERPKDVIDVLQRALELAESDAARVLTNKRLVTWLLQDERQSEALAACARWLSLAPSAEDALEQLRALSAITGEYGNFANALVEAAGRSDSSRLRVNLLLEAGEAQEDQAKAPEAATDLFARVLLDPDSGAEGKLRAARRLVSLLNTSSQAGQRLDVLEKLSALEPETSTRVELLGEAAELAEKLEDDERALRLWDTRLDLSPGDLYSLDAKILILERIERFEELQQTLLVRFGSSKDDTRRRADLVWIARIDEERLGRPQDAITSWRRVEEHFGANEETVDALARLLSMELRWNELITLLSAAIKAEQSVERKTLHHTMLGRIYASERAELKLAVQEYRAALDLEPTCESARTGLRDLLENRETQHSAAETLAASFDASGEWEKLLDIAETRLLAEPNPSARQGILLEAAQLLEDRAEKPAEALEYVERAFSIYPKVTIEEKMVQLAESTGAWHLVVSGYQRALRHCDELVRTTELLFEQGRTQEEKLGNLEDALSAYHRIVQLDASHNAAARAVIRCAGKLGRWNEVSWGLLRSAGAKGSIENDVASEVESTVVSPDQWDACLNAVQASLRGETPADVGSTELLSSRASHNVKHQVAKWHRDRRNDPSSAEQALAEAVNQHREQESLTMLCELRRAHPDPSLVESLLMLADIVDDALPALFEASRVALETVSDVELARPILDRCLDLAEKRIAKDDTKNNVRVASFCLESLVRIHVESGAPSTAFELLGRGARMNFETAYVLQLKHSAAEIAANSLQDTAKATQICREILKRQAGRRETINLLASLYEQEDQLPDLLELRQHELKLKLPDDRQLELRLDIARVLGSLNKPTTQRIEQLAANLEQMPGHVPSIDALEGIYAPLNQHRELYQLLFDQAAILEKKKQFESAAGLFARAGNLAEHPLQDADLAIDAYGRAIALAPSALVLDAMADIHSARGEHDAAITWLDQKLGLLESNDSEEYRASLVRLAQSLEAAGLVERAVTELRTGLDRDPDAQEVRDLLAKLYEETGAWPELADVLADGVDCVEEEETQVTYLTRAADIRWHRLDDLQGATPLLQRALELRTEDRDLRLTLANALRLGERHDEAKELLDGLLAEFGRRRTPERATVHFQLAQIARATGDLDEALGQLDAASTIQRSDPVILKTLGDVARDNGELERAERAYRALLLLVGRGGPSRGQAGSDIGASSILFELYRIATELKDSERAQDLLDSAVEAAEEDPAEARQLERSLELAGKWDLLLDALERRLAGTTDVAERDAILRIKANALRQLERLDDALELTLTLLERSPADTSLFEGAAELATKAGQVARFRARIIDATERLQLEDPKRACDIWLALGRDANGAADRTAAIQFFERAQETEAAPERALQPLLALHEAGADLSGKVRALRRFLATPHERLDDTALTNALFLVAELETCSEDLIEAGLEHLKVAMSRNADPSRAATILRTSIRKVGLHPESVELLESVARSAGDPDLLLQALEVTTQDESTSLEQLHEGVELAKRLGDLEVETQLLERAVRFAEQRGEVPEALWALTQLADRRVAQGAPEKTVALLELAATHSAEDDRFELEVRVAGIYSNDLNNDAQAARQYERLAHQRPGDARVWQPLIEIYRTLGSTEKLERALSRAEEHVTDEAQRRQLKLERVKLMLDEERFEETEVALREMLDGELEDESVYAVLLTLLERQGRYDDAVTMLHERLDVAIASGAETAAINYGCQLGSLFERQGDEGAAIEAYRTARNAAPQSRELLTALLRLVPAEEAGERADLMESLLPTEASEGAARMSLELTALRSTLGDEMGIERALELGVRYSPQSAELKSRLYEWYRSREDWLPLAELLANDAANTEDLDQALERFEEAAKLYEERLGDAVSAATVLKRALERAPAEPVILELYSQYQLTAGAGDQAVAALDHALTLDHPTDEAGAVLYHMRAAVRARADEHSLQAISAAVDDLDRAAQLGAVGVQDDLTALLSRQRELAELAGNVQVEQRVVHRLSKLLRDNDNAREALELLGNWVLRSDGDAESIRAWGELALEFSDWDASAQAHERLFELSEGVERRLAAIRFAEACEHKGVPMDARGVLDRARSEFPADAEIAQRVFRMYDAGGAHTDLAQVLLEEAEACNDVEQRFNLLLNAGSLLLRAEDPQPSGIVAFQSALELKPEDHAAQLGLANTYTRCGQIAEACGILENAIKGHGRKRSRELSELQHAMAAVADAAGDDEGRFAWLDAALQSDRKNGTVAAELAVFAMDRGEYNAAVKALQLVTLLKEECPMSRAEAYLRQGIIAQERGDKKKALLLGKRALNADQQYVPAQQFLEQLAGR